MLKEIKDIRNEIQSGMIVKVHQKVKETNTKGEEKERIQIYEGIVIAVKHGKEAGATMTVRKISDGVGVEKIYPIYSPVIDKIELVRQMKVTKSRPYYLRTYKKKLKEVKQEEIKEDTKEVKKEKIVAKKEETKAEAAK
ncbi:MAG: 50S ribosomal protein L19 [Candidatus Magasanikbacteria bacterium]